MATMYKWKKYNLRDESYTAYETEYYTDYETKRVKKTRDSSSHGSGYLTQNSANAAGWGDIARANGINGHVTTTSPGVSSIDSGWSYLAMWQEEYYVNERTPVTKTRSVPVTKTRKVKGSYVEEVKSSNRSAYPDNGQKSGYWYEYAGLANQAPSLTGSSTQIGNVKSDFTITYTVTDPDGDEVKVGIMVDNKVIQYPMAVPLNRSQSVTIRLEDYPLGEHTVTVTATDTSNASTSRTYYFSKTNQAPTCLLYTSPSPRDV